MIITKGCHLLDVYTDVVPFDSPPSYRGHMVMYSYKLTVGAQRINGLTKMLKIPFRVLCIPGEVATICVLVIVNSLSLIQNMLSCLGLWLRPIRILVRRRMLIL